MLNCIRREMRPWKGEGWWNGFINFLMEDLNMFQNQWEIIKATYYDYIYKKFPKHVDI